MTKCMYCERNVSMQEHFIVRQAVKPKGYPYRWKQIGACCDVCEASGCETNIEFLEAT